VAVALLGVTLGVARAADEGAAKAPDATLKLSAGSVSAGIGISWGSGTLTYQGKDYPITVSGLSVGDVGATKIEASGTIVGLKTLDDFDGNYTSVGVGATVAGGGDVLAMTNQNGVKVHLVTTTQGLNLSIGGAGVAMKIKK
jgi:hypothetical protein